MKRRTKRRIFRGSVTLVFVGIVTGLALQGGRVPTGRKVPVTAQDAVEAAVRTCEAKVTPELLKPVARWQLTDEASDQHGVMLTFAADVGGRSVTYRCEVTPTGTSIAAIDGS